MNNFYTTQTPIIISASRATDIPAFYYDWFKHRWQNGYVLWKNPFNGQFTKVSFEKTRLVVFWTKNPKPMLRDLDFLIKNIPNFYFQFSLNDYDEEGYEKNVPDLKKRIEIFKSLSNLISKEKVIWRFDPLILSDKINMDKLLNKIQRLGDELYGYTNKLVFSFIDITPYKKVSNNLSGLNFYEFSLSEMNEFAYKLQELNKSWNYEIGTCCESIDLDKFGILHNKCIDDDLIIKIFKKDSKLMEFLGVTIENDLFGEKIIKSKNLKDKGQRKVCGCIVAKDIGSYDTCPHGCVYCYANKSLQLALKNYKNHDKLGDKILKD